MDKVKILSTVTTFDDVQKTFQDIEKILNGLIDSTVTEAETEVTDTEGETGTTQITRNADKTYTFEIRTEDGWKTPVIGDSAITFKDKPAAAAKDQKKSIDEIEADDIATTAKVAEKTIFDEKADKFVIARPDYNSGWIDVTNDDTKHTLTHNLGSYPTLFLAWFTSDAAYNAGDPTVIYPMVFGMIRHGGSNWSGVEFKFTKTEIEYTCDASHHVHTNYRLDSGGNSWTDFNDGYMKLMLWK